ncbi:MAG: GNAT family N-acetyltransferase [Microthrixaceae bacterium]
MPRRRVAVALVPPPAVAAEVDTLRRAVGSGQLRRIPPHLTLVPPVNVGVDDVPAVLELLAAAARPARPFRLVLGPAASFAPATPTVHLAVGGDLPALGALREALSADPLGRPDPRPFVPHVTLDPRVEHDRVDACLAALRSVELAWDVDAVVLLEHLAREDRPPVWVPVAEEPLGGPAVVGRGGLELALRAGSVVTPEVADLLGRPRPAEVAVPDPGVRPLVVGARRRDGSAADGDLVGAAVGELLGPPDGVTLRGPVARLVHLVVEPSERGLGVGAQVLGRWCSAAAELGAGLVLADPDDGAGEAAAGGAVEFLERHGFRAAGGVHVRGLWGTG